MCDWCAVLIGKQPMPSEQVSEAVDRSIELSEHLNAIHPSSIELSERNDMAARLLSISLDHREAIMLLARHGANTSAFALARSCYESVLRGVWTHDVAPESEIARMSTGHFPKFDTIVKQIGKSGKLKALVETKPLAWSALSDYAHGGPAQVSRWSSGDTIEPVHMDVEVVDLLLIIDVYGCLACMFLHKIAGIGSTQIDNVFNTFVRPRMEASWGPRVGNAPTARGGAHA